MAVLRWHVAVMNGGLLAVGVFLATVTMTSVLAPPPSATTSSPLASDHRTATEAAARAVPPQRTRYAPIVARDIFRTGSSIGDGMSGFRLVGVATHLGFRFAVIEDVRSRKQRLYRRGDHIREDAGGDGELTIVRIAAQHIVLERNGAIFALDRTPRSHMDASQPAFVRTHDAEPSDQPIVRRSRGDEFFVDRREVQASLESLEQVARQIRAIPNFVHGQPTGYRVFGIAAGSIFNRLGLRNGDVIHRANGVALTDPTRALAFLNGLPRDRRVTLDVHRGQRTRTFTYEIQ